MQSVTLGHLEVAVKHKHINVLISDICNITLQNIKHIHCASLQNYVDHIKFKVGYDFRRRKGKKKKTFFIAVR